MYGGGLGGNDYSALSLGIGRDLMVLGALSADITRSKAWLPSQGTQQGDSYRLSYSKRFDDTNSQVTFAGYRFSDSGFMSMADYLSAKDNPNGNGISTGRSKEMYTLSFSQQFESLAMSGYLNYSHQTYWNQGASDRYDLTVARYFDIGHFRNINLSLTAYRNKFSNIRDDGMYLSLSMPWGSSGMMGYNGSYTGGANTHSINYSDRVGDTDNYTVRAGMSNSDADFSGYTHTAGRWHR
jgi:P pilus assembly protein, porin PapC